MLFFCLGLNDLFAAITTAGRTNAMPQHGLTALGADNRMLRFKMVVRSSHITF